MTGKRRRNAGHWNQSTALQKIKRIEFWLFQYFISLFSQQKAASMTAMKGSSRLQDRTRPNDWRKTVSIRLHTLDDSNDLKISALARLEK
jgi:hypothetical protein